MRLTKSFCVLSLLMTSVTLPLTACAQTAPEVVDSYPKQRLKERAEEERRAEEAARAAEEARRAEEAAAIASIPTVEPVALPLPSASSPMGMEMVVIQPGQGQLGSPISELKRSRFENPMKTTFIDYAFEVGKYEITFNDWDKCVSDGGCGGYRPKDGGWGKIKKLVTLTVYYLKPNGNMLRVPDKTRLLVIMA